MGTSFVALLALLLGSTDGLVSKSYKEAAKAAAQKPEANAFGAQPMNLKDNPWGDNNLQTEYDWDRVGHNPMLGDKKGKKDKDAYHGGNWGGDDKTMKKLMGDYGVDVDKAVEWTQSMNNVGFGGGWVDQWADNWGSRFAIKPGSGPRAKSIKLKSAPVKREQGFRKYHDGTRKHKANDLQRVFDHNMKQELKENHMYLNNDRLPHKNKRTVRASQHAARAATGHGKGHVKRPDRLNKSHKLPDSAVTNEFMTAKTKTTNRLNGISKHGKKSQHVKQAPKGLFSH